MPNVYAERKSQDVSSGPRQCKIPQRLLPGGRKRLSPNGKIVAKNVELAKDTSSRAATPAHSPSPQARNLRKVPASDPNPPLSEKSTRPSNVNDGSIGRKSNTRVARADYRFAGSQNYDQKRPSSLPKSVQDNSNRHQKAIVVPLTQKPSEKHLPGHPSDHIPIQKEIMKYRPPRSRDYLLPTQEMIRRCEELEVFNDSLDITKVLQEIMDRADESMPNDLMELTKSWDEKLIRYEDMKKDLSDLQGTILQLYASLKKTQTKLRHLGTEPQLPTTDDLRIMNLSKVSPNQLLQFFGFNTPTGTGSQSAKSDIVDFKKMYEAPSKLVIACEQLLVKRQEIIDWFDKLKEQHGISMSKYSKKINEFNAETQMLAAGFKSIKREFMLKLNEIVDQLRKTQNETMTLQVRTEELTYEISELNSLNADLRKQNEMGSHVKIHHVQSLEKELKEEKSIKAMFKERLSRVEHELKTNADRTVLVETALEQERAENWNLTTTVQELTEQNFKLQSDFDTELNKLTSSIKENTLHLEEIAEARQKLQTEKEDLEKRLAQLSDSYNESLENKNEEVKATLTKLILVESKYEEEAEAKSKLQQEHEAVCANLLLAQIKYKETLQLLEVQKAEVVAKEAEVESLKNQLQQSNQELEDCRHGLMKQNETISEIEKKFMETVALEKSLRSDIANKEEYIAELEKKDALLENQLGENENKMKCYEQELKTLKEDIEKLQSIQQTDNLDELHEMIDKQSAMFKKVAQEKEQLIETLKTKESEIDKHLDTLTQKNNMLQESNEVIKKLKQKEEEQTNHIKQLQNNLLMKSNEVRHETDEKNTEIDTLEANLETRMKQVKELQDIIHSLEEQLRKLSTLRQKDQGRIMKLERTITEYETYHMEARCSQKNSVDNLDNLIKILEEELGTTYEPKIGDELYGNNPVTHFEDVNQDSENIKFHVRDKVPTKIEMGNYIKKIYIATNEEAQRGENLDRKRPITQMDTQRSLSLEQDATSAPHAVKANLPRLTPIPFPPGQTRNEFLNNLQYLNTNQHRDEKKHKMFKLAGHRLSSFQR